ncbi:unnamed protein product, partial [Tetraodon nigroviridis]
NFIAVRKEDAGEYFCRAKNDAGFAECPPQQMEIYDINVAGIVLGVVVVLVVLLCITAGICAPTSEASSPARNRRGTITRFLLKGMEWTT